MEDLKFINDVIKPWDELNQLLSERYAFQPELSDITRQVESLAISIKHQIDKCTEPQLKQKIVNCESKAARLMSDIADYSKHGPLWNPERNTTINLSALFEVNNNGQFRFIRNCIYVKYDTTSHEQDFLEASMAAMNYWIKKRSLKVLWTSDIKEASEEFFETAFLRYNPKLCINMSKVNLRFFKRAEDGGLFLYKPENVIFEVY